ncbi:lipopolysaccharide biosynthesis protein [Bacteroidota bacterium]
MNSIKSLAKETAIYGVSSIIGRMLTWLMVPLYTAYLNAADYGIVTELYAYSAFLIVLYTYGMETAYFRFSTRKSSGENIIFNNSETSLLISSLVISGLLILLSTPITNYLEYPGRERYIIWFAVILILDSILAIPFARLRLEGRAKRFAATKLTNIFVTIVLNIFFIVICLGIYKGQYLPYLKPVILKLYNPDRLVDYIFISNLIASVVMSLMLTDIWLKIRISINRDILVPMYKYALPLLIMGLAGVTNEMLSRAMLKKILPENFYPEYSNQAALGIFGAVYKLSVFMTLAIQAFRYAAEPFFFSRSGDKNAKVLYSEVMHWFIIFGTLAYLLLSLNLDIIANLFLRSPEYHEGLIVVPVLLLANLFLGIYFNLSVWFKLTDKTYFGMYISLGGALITIVLNLILIPLFGYLGSAYVTLVCYLSMCLIAQFLGKRHFPIPYQTRRDLTYIILSVILVYIGLNIDIEQLIIRKIIQILIIAVYISIIILFERNKLKQVLTK